MSSPGEEAPKALRLASAELVGAGVTKEHNWYVLHTERPDPGEPAPVDIQLRITLNESSAGTTHVTVFQKPPVGEADPTELPSLFLEKRFPAGRADVCHGEDEATVEIITRCFAGSHQFEICISDGSTEERSIGELSLRVIYT